MTLFWYICIVTVFSIENFKPVEGRGRHFLVQKFKEYGFFEDGVLSAAPKNLLEVKYLEKNVNPGDKLQVAEVVSQPDVVWNCKPGVPYALILCDPDAPVTTPDKPFLHWWVENIPSCDISKGNTLYEYIPPSPPTTHRYLFLLWEQKALVNSTGTTTVIVPNRFDFAVPRVSSKYMSSPAAGNFMLVNNIVDTDTDQIVIL